MKKESNQGDERLKSTAKQFVAMSQKGTVGFFEETVLESLVNYFLKKKDTGMALAAAEWAATLYPYSSDTARQWAETLYACGLYPEALGQLGTTLSLDPTDASAKLLKTGILIEMGRYERAKEVLADMESDFPSPQELSGIHLCHATIHEHLDDHRSMFESLCQAIRADLDNEEILERLGLCAEFSQKHQEHIRFLQEFLNERPYSAVAWFNLGHSLWYRKDYEEAAEAFEYAYLIDPFFQQAYMDRAEVLSNIREYDETLTCYEDAGDNCAPSAELLVGKGGALLRLGQFEHAISCFRHAADLSPRHADAFFGIGTCHMEMGNDQGALKAFSRAFELDNRREEFAAAVGEAHYRLGDLKAAAAFFDRAIELAPEMSEHWVRFVSFLMNEGRFEEAWENLSAAFMNTYGTELKYCHAAYCFRTGDRMEGLHILQQAVEEDFPMHSSLLHLCPELGSDMEIMNIINTYRPVG